MAEFKTFTNVVEIPLDRLEINIGQVRTTNVGQGITELAESIRVQGLLEPILVCPSPSKKGKYEILAGQRRFLAVRELGDKTIKAIIHDKPVDETKAKEISLTENLLRNDLSDKDKRTACLVLWRRYKSIDLIEETTGLPRKEIGRYLDFEDLPKVLQHMVDTGDISIDSAARVNQAGKISGETSNDELVALAKQMSGMSGVQQKEVVAIVKSKRDISSEDAIEEAKTKKKIPQLTIQLGPKTYTALNSFAETAKTNQKEAARTLIEEGLHIKGYLKSVDEI
jgi:ParB family chromosome partitioning protein